MSGMIYLDYCATTPVDPKVREAMQYSLEAGYGNPSSMHSAGREAARLIDKSRCQVADGIGCEPEEIIFTSGATEADNLALLGVLRSKLPEKTHLITSAIEHHAVLHAAQQLEREGYAVTYLPVNSMGLVDPGTVREAIRPETALISIMMVNNEMGAIEPIEQIGRIAREAGVLMHTDAVQAVGLLDVQVNKLNVDMLSLSAHKIYGPKGIGALYVRKNTRLSPLIYGGPQERSLRPGTENVPGIVGLGTALELVTEHKPEEYQRLKRVRDQLIVGLNNCIPGILINGPEVEAAPHIVSASFPHGDAEAMLLRL
ncbi:MAG: cysteine desulfurase, partial [Chloroflexi bacterium]